MNPAENEPCDGLTHFSRFPNSVPAEQFRMNWFAYISLIMLSASVLGNALAFHRAARNWAHILSAELAVVVPDVPDPIFAGLVFSTRTIQHTLVPPGVFFWFWFGLLSTAGGLVEGGIY